MLRAPARVLTELPNIHFNETKKLLDATRCPSLVISEVRDAPLVKAEEEDDRLGADGGITLPGYRNPRGKRRCEETAFVNSNREQRPTQDCLWRDLTAAALGGEPALPHQQVADLCPHFVTLSGEKELRQEKSRRPLRRPQVTGT